MFCGTGSACIFTHHDAHILCGAKKVALKRGRVASSARPSLLCRSALFCITSRIF